MLETKSHVPFDEQNCSALTDPRFQRVVSGDDDHNHVLRYIQLAEHRIERVLGTRSDTVLRSVIARTAILGAASNRLINH